MTAETSQNLLEVKRLVDDESSWYTVSLLLAFATKCMARLSACLDLFQSREPQSHLVTGRMSSLLSYYRHLSVSSDPSDFGILPVIQGIFFLPAIILL